MCKAAGGHTNPEYDLRSEREDYGQATKKTVNAICSSRPAGYAVCVGLGSEHCRLELASLGHGNQSEAHCAKRYPGNSRQLQDSNAACWLGMAGPPPRGNQPKGSRRCHRLATSPAVKIECQCPLQTCRSVSVCNRVLAWQAAFHTLKLNVPNRM